MREIQQSARPADSAAGWSADTLEACRRGDQETIGRVLSAEAPAVERTLSRTLGSRSDVEDVLQQTFVAAIRAFPNFRGEASVRTWLTSIAIRFAQERRQHAARQLVLVHEAQVDRSDLGRELDDRRRVARLRAVLAGISPKKRAAFVLHVVEGRSIDEVAVLVGASRAATKSRIFFARRELMKKARRDPLLSDWLDGSTR
ncbi:MAG: RNA polymerase sigma factor [Myxococcales bacterium]|nr:RNA polymerase sigma factor [Myxococcales bacterium]